MKREVIFLMLLISLVKVYAQESIINIDASAEGNYFLADKNIIVEKEGRMLFVDVESLGNSTISDSISSITLKIEADTPIIMIEAGDKITIKQEALGNTTVYFKVPNIYDNSSYVYLTEHYVPDKELTDGSRTLGIRRIAVVSKGSEADISVKSILGYKGGYTLNVKEFLNFEGDYGKDIEVDMLKEGKATEMFFYKNSLMVRSYDFMLNLLFDRGFTSAVLLKESTYVDLGETEDQYPERCTKLGVMFNGAYKLSDVSQLTNNQGIVFFESDDAQKIAAFAEEAEAQGTEIGLIISKDVLSPENLSSALENITSAVYLDILKGNSSADNELIAYTDFVVNLKEKIQNAQIIIDTFNETQLQYISNKKGFIDLVSYVSCENCTADEAAFIENITGNKKGLVQFDDGIMDDAREKINAALINDAVSIYVFREEILDSSELTDLLSKEICGNP